MSKSKTVNVKLLKQHTHAGKQYQADEVIELSERQAQFVIAAKAGEKTTAKPDVEKAD